VKAALAAQDIGAWFRRMPWHKGDSPINVAPEYEDCLFEQWSHGIFDDYWKEPGTYAEGFYDRYADVPIVHLSGWYDPYARTAMENYVGLSRAKRSRMQLILGPWTHAMAAAGAARPSGRCLRPAGRPSTCMPTGALLQSRRRVRARSTTPSIHAIQRRRWAARSARVSL